MRRGAIWFVVAAFGIVGAPSVSRAIEPGRDIAQLKHTRWTLADGLPGRVNAFAQTPDGFLWLGMSNGLYRFDGRSFEAVHGGDAVEQAEGGVFALLVTRNGDLWMAFEKSGRFARYRRGKLEFLPSPPKQGPVVALVEDGDGSVWAGASPTGAALIHYVGRRWQLVRPIAQEPNQWSGMVVSGDGALWIGYATYVARKGAGEANFRIIHRIADRPGRIFGDGTGRIWLMDQGSIRLLAGVRGEPPLRSPGSISGIRDFRPGYPLVDRHGTLWIARRGQGILRFAPAPGLALPDRYRVESFKRVDGLSSDMLTAIFEDRQGNVWVSSTAGLDRFRATDIVVEPRLVKPAPYGDKLLAASDDSVYVAEADALYRIRPRGRPEPIATDVQEPWGLCEAPDGLIWLIESGGLRGFREGRQQRRLPAGPSIDNGLYDCAADRAGNVWLSAHIAGLYRWTGRQWIVERDAPTAPTALLARDGPWIALSREKELWRRDSSGAWRQWHREATLPTGTLPNIHASRSGIVVMGDDGMALVADDGVRLNKSQPAFTRANGLVQTNDGTTWVMGKPGLLRMRTRDFDRSFRQPGFAPPMRVFDFVDGLPDRYSPFVLRSLVRGGDGRLWAATSAGTVWLDPANLHRNPDPPSVQITVMEADGQRRRNPVAAALRAGTSNLRFDFAVPNPGIPERVQVRYRLVGYDERWIDPGQRRQAFYTNLPPGNYAFRVIAANESGVWNRTGAVATITIPPTFLQSKMFLLLCAAAAALILWVLHRLRVRWLAARFQLRVEERLAERERIARELHDTLLQSVQGLLLKFQAIADRMGRATPLHDRMESTLDDAEAVLAEARQRVFDLRSSATTSPDLRCAIDELICAAGFDEAVTVAVSIEGAEEALNPPVAAEILAIIGEGLRNAARHAGAHSVTIHVVFGAKTFAVTIADDGRGIPLAYTEGRAPNGHFGLIGMRERAARIGATLSLGLRAPTGTQLALHVPASAAYRSQLRRRLI